MWGAVGALLQFRGPLAYLRAENVGIAMKTAGAWRSAKTGNWPNIILSSTKWRAGGREPDRRLRARPPKELW